MTSAVARSLMVPDGIAFRCLRLAGTGRVLLFEASLQWV